MAIVQQEPKLTEEKEYNLENRINWSKDYKERERHRSHSLHVKDTNTRCVVDTDLQWSRQRVIHIKTFWMLNKFLFIIASHVKYS